MSVINTKWLLVGLACLVLWPANLSAQSESWDEHVNAAFVAQGREDFATAAAEFKLAAKAAELSATDHMDRLLLSTSSLSLIYSWEYPFSAPDTKSDTSLVAAVVVTDMTVDVRLDRFAIAIEAPPHRELWRPMSPRRARWC